MRAPKKGKPKATVRGRKGKVAARSRTAAKSKAPAKAASKAKAVSKAKAATKARAAARGGSKSKAAPKPRRTARVRPRKIERKRPPPLASVAIGDAVRIPAQERNLIGRYDPRSSQDGRGGEGIEGVVCSVREIKTGRLVPKTSGDLSDYVLEVVHSQTFRLHYGSDRNTGGPRGPEDFRENPVWQRLRVALREMAADKKLVSISVGAMWGEPLRSLLDGWRVVKVKAQHVEAMT